MYKLATIPIFDSDDIRNRLVEFSRHFQLSIILDSHDARLTVHGKVPARYKLLAGFSKSAESTATLSHLSDLKSITAGNDNWYLGHLAYDLKNDIEHLVSEKPDGIGFPKLFFFIPEILMIAESNELIIYSGSKETDGNKLIQQLKNIKVPESKITFPKLLPRISKRDYIDTVNKLQGHIQRGDIYEVNFCMEFFQHAKIDPYIIQSRIAQHTPSPFSAFVKYHNKYLLSASPERFLMKHGDKIISQPIKGTAPRGETPRKDLENLRFLENNLKERTENIMITDLVRNDLSKIALRNSVQVEELCRVYPYPHVYQMISTVAARLPDISLEEIIRATFPMGSMTGAPKIRAMQLIEECELTKRGLYSGAVGYIGPGMDFDFNVVIRSLQYNAESGYLSYIAGSAITALSDPEKEYEECLLKSYAINPKQNHHV